MPVIQVPAEEEGGSGGLLNLLKEKKKKEEEEKEDDDEEEEMEGKRRVEGDMQDSLVVEKGIRSDSRVPFSIFLLTLQLLLKGFFQPRRS